MYSFNQIYIHLTKPVVPVSTNPIPSISNWYHLILTQYHFCTNHCCALLTLTLTHTLSLRNALFCQLDLVMLVIDFLGRPVYEEKNGLFTCLGKEIEKADQ